MALSPDPLQTPYLDPAFVTEVVTIPDPLERNSAITRGYHDLSEAVTALLGRDHANWLTFGQWASAEARESIDGSAVPAVVRPFFGHEISAAVAAGNAAIFGDVAPMFIRFVSLFAAVSGRPSAGRPSADAEVESARAARTALLADPLIAREQDLVRAFAAYADAFDLLAAGDPDPGRRAQRMLVANASIGAHEQRVADPYVRAAIPGRWISAIVATSHMGLKVPEGMLQLQRDVPRPAYLEGAQFPPHLAHLDDPEACALATRFHQDPDTVADSDAPDWESYDERMGFIYTLLRVYQGDPALFPLPPGTPGWPPGADAR